jgi:4-hydroxythreonine-4-phosphate dehydrogenase
MPTNPANFDAPAGRPPRIAITMGDPAGVGPECVVKALANLVPRAFFLPVVIGDQRAWKRALQATSIDLPWRAVDFEASDLEAVEQVPVVNPLEDLSDADIEIGAPSRSACHATVEWIGTAIRWALEGRVQAICTGPIHKANLHRHGFDFPGHTEFLKHMTGADRVVMMLAGPRLKVSLVTIHEPLRRVPGLLTIESVTQTILITADTLVRDLATPTPRIAVCGLNPHAGESGRFGTEESEIIEPAIAACRNDQLQVSGPYPPDTVFYRAYQGEFDAVVAMYHDQGLAPLKLVHFDNAVNVTMGLPIIRTSVDHGTAYDIAGTGRARSSSMEEALRLAALMARNRGRGPGVKGGGVRGGVLGRQ